MVAWISPPVKAYSLSLWTTSEVTNAININGKAKGRAISIKEVGLATKLNAQFKSAITSCICVSLYRFTRIQTDGYINVTNVIIFIERIIISNSNIQHS